jgi:hypothetical protein
VRHVPGCVHLSLNDMSIMIERPSGPIYMHVYSGRNNSEANVSTSFNRVYGICAAIGACKLKLTHSIWLNYKTSSMRFSVLSSLHQHRLACNKVQFTAISPLKTARFKILSSRHACTHYRFSVWLSWQSTGQLVLPSSPNATMILMLTL